MISCSKPPTALTTQPQNEILSLLFKLKRISSNNNNMVMEKKSTLGIKDIPLAKEIKKRISMHCRGPTFKEYS